MVANAAPNESAHATSWPSCHHWAVTDVAITRSLVGASVV